jgi:O-antigen biosynthesis protein
MNSAKLRALPSIALLLPLDVLVACFILAAYLVLFPLRLFRRRPKSSQVPADISSVTIQILNWDGLHLLKECLPSVVEAVRRHSIQTGGRHEVLIVDNGSRDGSVDFLRERFPEVRVVVLDRNYGFSIGNNKGFDQVRSDIVVLLNNDMQVRPDFLEPLLTPFVDPGVFAVASQIFFTSSLKRREETGKTRGQFEQGFFRFWHDEILPADENRAGIPIFWAGGGSCALDLRKLKSIGGFDSLYHPFYVEDTDVCWQAWKRGWQCLFAPKSQVIHKHRGTSRPKFGDDYVDSTIRRNQFLFIWKNVTEAGLILQHLIVLPRIHGSAILQKGARFEIRSYVKATARLPFAVWRRVVNFREYVVSDRDVLRSLQ